MRSYPPLRLRNKLRDMVARNIHMLPTSELTGVPERSGLYYACDADEPTRLYVRGAILAELQNTAYPLLPGTFKLRGPVERIPYMSEQQRDQLYGYNINPVSFRPGVGVYVASSHVVCREHPDLQQVGDVQLTKYLLHAYSDWLNWISKYVSSLMDWSDRERAESKYIFEELVHQLLLRERIQECEVACFEVSAERVFVCVSFKTVFCSPSIRVWLEVTDPFGHHHIRYSHDLAALTSLF